MFTIASQRENAIKLVYQWKIKGYGQFNFSMTFGFLRIKKLFLISLQILVVKKMPLSRINMFRLFDQNLLAFKLLSP